MNFNQLQYWPGLIAMFGVFFFIVVMMEKRFFNVVKTYWFYNRSIFSYLSTFLFLAGMGGLLLSLLDLRGPEEKIKTEVPQDRTIILIDTSASMLAEDVKPSRLQKATLIAKHFARKAAGQQLSIVAFAEIQKKIVPFTNDLDLIDARLDSLKNLRNQYGSSALSLAIQESIQYFRETGGEARGNLLIFTDGEETAEGIKLQVPKDVHVALVGIGTTMGGRIPLDDSRGFRFGYKKDKGRDIITKLNENFFKKVTADIPSAKYWLANSYSLPSEEILEFFRGEVEKGKDQQDMVIKPVLVEWIVIPALVLIVISYFFKFLRVFSLGLLLIVMPVHAQENEKKEAPELSPEVISRLTDLQNGSLNRLERIKLADDLHRGGSKEEALSLYEENLPKKIDKSIPSEAYLNYGTSLLEKGEVQKGLDVYSNLNDSLSDSAEDKRLRDTIDKNIVTFFKKQEEKKKQDKQKKDDKEQKEGDDKDKSGQSGQDQKNKEGSGKQDKQKSQGSSQDPKQDEKKKEDQEKNEDKEKDQGEEDKKEDQKQPDQGEKKPLPPKKMPAKLKQLMSDDRQLQMKMIENGTKDLNKRKSRTSKDW